jgi:pyrroloquinoline quinone biosynthesis protein B
MNTAGLPVWCSPAVAAFLRANAPWSQLVALGNIEVVELAPGRPLRLSEALEVTAVPVPHRAELSDTVAYRVQGPGASLLHCPDIDSWAAWDQDLAETLAAVDLALLDGTFHDAGELGGRSMAEVPHPLVADTAARVAGSRCRVVLVHLNHTNPLVEDGPERARLTEQGLIVGREGMRWPLGAG